MGTVRIKGFSKITNFEYILDFTEYFDVYYCNKSFSAIVSLDDFIQITDNNYFFNFSSGVRPFFLMKLKQGYKFDFSTVTSSTEIFRFRQDGSTSNVAGNYYKTNSDFNDLIRLFNLENKAIIIGASSVGTLGINLNSSYTYNMMIKYNVISNYVIEDKQNKHLKIELPTIQNFNVYINDSLNENLNDFIFENSVNIKLYPKTDYKINEDKNLFSVGFSSSETEFSPLGTNSITFSKNADYVELNLNDTNSDIYNTIFILDSQQNDIFKIIIVEYPYNVAFTTLSNKFDVYFNDELQENENVFYGSENPIKVTIKPKDDYKWAYSLQSLPIPYNIRYSEDISLINIKAVEIYFINGIPTYTTQSKYESVEITNENDFVLIDITKKIGEIYETSISDLTYTIKINGANFEGQYIKYTDSIEIDFYSNDFYKFDELSPLPSVIYINTQNNKIENIFSTYLSKNHCKLNFIVTEIFDLDIGLGVGGRAIPDVVIGQKPIYTQKNNSIISIEIDSNVQNFITENSKNLYVRAISNDKYFFDEIPTIEITINNNVQSFNFQKLDSSNYFISIDLTSFNFDSIDSIIVYADSVLISDISDFSTFKLFKLSNNDIKEIMSKRIVITQTDNYYSIQDLGKYIHSIKKFYCSLPSGYRENIYLGNLLVSSNKPTIQDLFFSLSFGVVSIPKKYNNAMDSQKLEIYLYLPFTDNDFIILDSEKYFNKDIELIYKISTISGDTVINIIDNNNRELLDVFNGNVTLNLPFVLSDTIGYNQNTNINKTILKELNPFIKIIWFDTIEDVSNISYFDKVENLQGFYKIDRIENENIFNNINLTDLEKIKSILLNGVYF